MQITPNLSVVSTQTAAPGGRSVARAGVVAAQARDDRRGEAVVEAGTRAAVHRGDAVQWARVQRLDALGPVPGPARNALAAYLAVAHSADADAVGLAGIDVTI